MSSKSVIPASLLLAAGLSGAPDTLATDNAERTSFTRTTSTAMPEDSAAPGAVDRLAQRGGTTHRVGSDVATCDFDNLGSALAAAASGDTILLEKDETLYLGDTYALTNRGVTIRGGYADCTDNSPSGRTILDADGNGRVFDLWLQPGSNNQMDVVLENLVIRGGVSSNYLGGGGLLVDGRQGLMSVELVNVQVTNNSAEAGGNGGGINVIVNGDPDSNGRLLGVDDDSQINGNTTLNNGGGLSCENDGEFAHQGTVVRIGAADIANNSAENGGGLSFNNCRNVFIYNGGPVVLVIPTGAIFNNTASGNGGGMYITGSTLVTMRGDRFDGFGDGDHAAHIVLNQAENGGGIYIDSGTVNLDGTVLASNEANNNGGGIHADGNFLVRHRRMQNEPCQPSTSSNGVTSVPRCSRMTGNTAVNGGGGGYYITNASTLEVDRTIITENHSELAGSAVRATSDTDTNPGVANFFDSLVYGNTGVVLFYGQQTSEINVAWSTITDNDIEHSVFRGFATGTDETSIGIVSSIVWESSGEVLTLGGTGTQSASADCMIGHQDAASTDINPANFYSNIDPDLITVDDKPYFPSDTSPAIDYCDDFNAAENQVDLVGVERGTEHQGPDPVEPPTSAFGFYDLGAYETQWPPLGDEIFQDRFE